MHKFALRKTAEAFRPSAPLPLTREVLAGALDSGKIATGGVASVPVGYAKAALESLGLWSIAEGSFAFTDNVRSALMFVARKEAPPGIVYATAPKSEPKVKVVATIPASAHPPIVYPVALTSIVSGERSHQVFVIPQKAKTPRRHSSKKASPSSPSTKTNCGLCATGVYKWWSRLVGALNAAISSAIYKKYKLSRLLELTRWLGPGCIQLPH